jgi:hypothetical protein
MLGTKTAPAWTCAILEPNALTVIITRKGERGRELDLPIAKAVRTRGVAVSRARYSLPARGAQSPRVHLPHIAHPDHADALAVLHGDGGARCCARVSCRSSAHVGAVDEGMRG